MPVTLDPVLKFLLDPETAKIALQNAQRTGSGSQLVSGRTISFVGHALIKKRCREIGVPEPDASAVYLWQKQLKNGELI